MARDVRVALIVDNPLRDLPGLVLLASRLACAGAVVHLVPMNLQDTELRALAPDCVVLNYLRPTNDRLARQLVDAGVALVVLDTEGGVLSSLDAYDRTLTTDVDLRSSIAAYCSWGATLATAAVDRGWFRPDQVVVTGAPRFDFYADPWRAAALASSPAGHQPKTILVNSNFPVANPRFQSPTREAEMLVRQFGWAEAEVTIWRKTQERSLQELVAMTNLLAAARPDAQIVYRPHPFERASTYDGLLLPLRNLRLAKEGSVDGWILNSCAVIQRSCTTAVEAALSGVPALSPRWVPTPFEMEAAERVSVPCSSMDELESRVAAALAGDRTVPASVQAALAATIDQWFHRVDGHSHERVAAVVLDRAASNDRTRQRSRTRNVGTGRGVSGRLKSTAKRWLPPEARGLRSGASWRSWRRSEKGFGATDVERVARAIAAADSSLPALTIRPAARGDAARLAPFLRSVSIEAAR